MSDGDTDTDTQTDQSSDSSGDAKASWLQQGFGMAANLFSSSSDNANQSSSADPGGDNSSSASSPPPPPPPPPSGDDGANQSTPPGGFSSDPDQGGQSVDTSQPNQSVAPPPPQTVSSDPTNPDTPDNPQDPTQQRIGPSARTPDYEAGFKAGLAGDDFMPDPRAGDALEDFRAGYAAGQAAATQSQTGPADSDGSLTDTGEDLAKSKGLVLAGEQAGKKVGTKLAEKAAEEAAQKAIISQAAKTGGVIGTAIDFATSPGGDTQLPHTIYQATRPDGSLIPGMGWHVKRENAERDAATYTANTGEPAVIEEDFSKASDDPE